MKDRALSYYICAINRSCEEGVMQCNAVLHNTQDIYWAFPILVGVSWALSVLLVCKSSLSVAMAMAYPQDVSSSCYPLSFITYPASLYCIIYRHVALNGRYGFFYPIVHSDHRKKSTTTHSEAPISFPGRKQCHRSHCSRHRPGSAHFITPKPVISPIRARADRSAAFCAGSMCFTICTSTPVGHADKEASLGNTSGHELVEWGWRKDGRLFEKAATILSIS